MKKDITISLYDDVMHQLESDPATRDNDALLTRRVNEARGYDMNQYGYNMKMAKEKTCERIRRAIQADRVDLQGMYQKKRKEKTKEYEEFAIYGAISD